MGTLRAHLGEFETQEDRDDVARLQNGNVAHSSGGDRHRVRADELGVEARRISILQEQLENLTKIRVEFVERFRLGVSAREAGHVADVEARVRATLDDCGVGAHLLLREIGSGTPRI